MAAVETAREARLSFLQMVIFGHLLWHTDRCMTKSLRIRIPHAMDGMKAHLRRLHTHGAGAVIKEPVRHLAGCQYLM